jgi:hypothetical protein
MRTFLTGYVVVLPLSSSRSVKEPTKLQPQLHKARQALQQELGSLLARMVKVAASLFIGGNSAEELNLQRSCRMPGTV